MNIAICDDDIKMLGLLEQIVFECFNGDLQQFVCESFTSGEELISYIQKNIGFQIYIMDIEMKEINGLQTAAQIRAVDKNAIIIFVTSHKELMQQAFDVLAFNYIVKPLDRENTKRIILKAIEFIQDRQSIFYFKIGKNSFTINYGDIEYFESNKRKILLHTSKNMYEFYGKLKELKLNTNFSQVHTSYIINLEKIQSVSKSQIIMNSGIEIKISKKYYTSFNNNYRNFLIKRYE